MKASKLQIKFFLQANGSSVDLEPFVPVFHGWIRNNLLGELLIDVADYAHVVGGPGVVLIGHGSDYFLDLSEGRPGLLYTRKREAPPGLPELLEDAFARSLRACQLLEQDKSLPRPVRFRTDELLVRIPDRLHAPNTPETFERFRPELERALGKLMPGVKAGLEPHGSPQHLFGVRVSLPDAPGVDTLLGRLTA